MAKNRTKQSFPRLTLKEILIQLALPGVIGAAIYVWSWRSFNDDVTVIDSAVDALIFLSFWALFQILMHRKRIFQK